MKIKGKYPKGENYLATVTDYSKVSNKYSSLSIWYQLSCNLKTV